MIRRTRVCVPALLSVCMIATYPPVSDLFADEADEFHQRLRDFKSEIISEADYCRYGTQYELLGSIEFETGSDSISSEQRVILNRYAEFLDIEGPQRSRIRIEGFGDAQGDPVKNIGLSRKRALNVRSALNSKPDQLPVNAVGVGVEVADKQGEEAGDESGSANRRADILIARDNRIQSTPVVQLVVSEEMSTFSADNPKLGAMFRASEPVVQLPERGVVEFWFRSKKEEPATQTNKATAEPTLSNTQILFAMHLSAGKSFAVGLSGNTKLVVWRTPDPDVEIFEFDGFIPTGKLHHLTVSFEKGSLTVWVDGEAVGSVNVDLSAARVQEFVFGGFAPSRNYFNGQMGRFRIWSDNADCSAIRELASTAKSGNLTLLANDLLLARTTRSPKTQSLDMTILQRANRPTTGAWHIFGSDQIQPLGGHVLNADSPSQKADSDESAAGLETLSGTGHSPDNLDIKSEHLRRLGFRDDRKPEDIFSAYPLYQIEWQPNSGHRAPDDTIYRQSIQLPAKSRFRHYGIHLQGFNVHLTQPVNGQPAHIAAIDMTYSEHPSLKTTSRKLVLDANVDLGDTRAYEANCSVEDGAPRVRLYPDEQIRGFTGYQREGFLLSLVIHTNQRSLRSCNPAPQPDGGVSTATNFELWLPDGAVFSGFADIANPTASNVETRLVPLTRGQWNKARIALIREDAVSSVFTRIGRNEYRSVEKHPLALPENCGSHPVLKTLTTGEIQSSCDGVDFIFAAKKPNPSRSSQTFDNTFVRLSKAVNLQANYRGYDLAKMDPLHLVDTGRTQSVFRMPSASSKDYFDFNRIFIPDGLFYVPEFTGGNVTKTTVSSDTSEYRTHFSQTVGVSGGAEAAPEKEGGPKDGAKFGASNTVNRARSIMHGQGKELSLSTSQVALYALVLNKAHMSLDRQFRRRLEYLKAFPSAANFDSFVRTYGTHYPGAVIYGGMGVLELHYDGTETGSGFENSQTKAFNAQASLKGISGGFNFEQTKGVAENFAKQMSTQFENFYWVGGAHAGASRESWGVGLDGVVPVYVELRSIDELLLPPFVSDPAISFGVRHKLQSAVSRYIDQEAEAEKRREQNLLNLKDHRFSITLKSVRVDAVGDEKDSTYELAGSIELGEITGGRLHSKSSGYFINRPGPKGAEEQENARRPALEFDWDGDRVSSFKQAFLDGFSAGGTAIEREIANRQLKAIDYSFTTSKALDGEEPEQILVVRRDAFRIWRFKLKYDLKEADTLVNEALTGVDDVLKVRDSANLTFTISDFPQDDSVKKKYVQFRETDCGAIFGCTQISMTFELRKLSK